MIERLIDRHVPRRLQPVAYIPVIIAAWAIGVALNSLLRAL